MIIDTSAIICLIRREPQASHVLHCLSLGLPHRMSTTTASELFAVVTRTVAPGGWNTVARLIDAFNVEMVEYDSTQVAIFQHAYTTYGRGGHNSSSAHLNLGDCFSYALAKALDEPLLFIGNDFTHTDIVSAIDYYHDKNAM